MAVWWRTQPLPVQWHWLRSADVDEYLVTGTISSALSYKITSLKCESPVDSKSAQSCLPSWKCCSGTCLKTVHKVSACRQRVPKVPGKCLTSACSQHPCRSQSRGRGCSGALQNQRRDVKIQNPGLYSTQTQMLITPYSGSAALSVCTHQPRGQGGDSGPGQCPGKPS